MVIKSPVCRLDQFPDCLRVLNSLTRVDTRDNAFSIKLVYVKSNVYLMVNGLNLPHLIIFCIRTDKNNPRCWCMFHWFVSPCHLVQSVPVILRPSPTTQVKRSLRALDVDLGFSDLHPPVQPLFLLLVDLSVESGGEDRNAAKLDAPLAFAGVDPLDESVEVWVHFLLLCPRGRVMGLGIAVSLTRENEASAHPFEPAEFDIAPDC